MIQFAVAHGAKTLVLTVALALGTGLFAQEIVVPLHSSPRPDTHVSLLKSGGLNTHFDYLNDTMQLPIVDDFSVDRIRHLNAQQGDANVALTQTIYKLELNGSSTPNMAYRTTATFHYTVDITPDTLIVTADTIPHLVVIVKDLTVWPVTQQSMYVWPPYTLVDTVGNATTDTLALTPDLVQDSLLVYSVSADPRTYKNPDNSIAPLILWADDDAYVNSTFPLNPPTIGVATLDGMDRTGYPYLISAPNTEGSADKLTSVPINLAYPASDSIYLSFFSEPIGLSGDDQAHAVDSLHLELYAPDEHLWYPVWSAPGTAVPDTFKQVMIPIKDTRFLKQGFQMRFRNDATLGGAVDQWHVDYVRLGRNRNVADTVLKDVAYVYAEAGLLQTFTSVPYAKFVQSPASYMAQQVDIEQRNNDTQDKFVTWGYGVSSDCGWSTTRANYGNNISNNAYSDFNTTHPVNSGADPLVYDVSGCSGAAFLTAKFWTNATPDVCAYNDTMAYTQEISNYYSYDDGTAEAGYGLGGGAGAEVAYRFDTQGTDSLRALRIYFDPIFTYDQAVNNPLNGTFIITVWSSLDPETILYQNVSYSTLQILDWGPNHFVEYPLDSTIAVGGTFYVGWVQTDDNTMYVGLDKNRDNHDKMFYNTGLGWTASAQVGSLMIRPVMVAAVDPFAAVPEIAAPQSCLTVWPNPASDVFSLRMGDGEQTFDAIEMIDPMGRTVKHWNGDGKALSVQGVAPGVYVVRTLGRDGRTLAQGRLIVQ